jgi:hypothetical protein
LTTYAFARADGSLYATKSALSEGKWVKIRVNETGFYKLTYSDLKKMGFASPEKVSVHGYGGFPMEEDLSKAVYMDDVPSIPVWRGEDFILFYGKGTVKWTYNASKKIFTHENNAYSTYGCYFVTDATETNEAEQTPSTGNATVQINTYDDYMLHELDKVSITTSGRPNSGRELFGESFDSNTSQIFPFEIPGITNDDGRISYRFVAKIKSGTGKVILSADDIPLMENTINQNNQTYVAALDIVPEVEWPGEKSEETVIKISFSISQQISHLDYIRLQMKRQLQPYGAATFFRSIESIGQETQFNISNASANLLVFDVTEGRQMKRMETTLSGSQASFTIPVGSLCEFAMVDLTKTIPTPETVGEVKSQNLHGMAQTDMIILSPDAFTAEAERLADAHRLRDGLTVSVVTPEQVYNEFSSGAPEAAAIRLFMKMFYDRRTSDSDAPKFLLLFGDGRFDNRKLTDVWKNSSDNYLLTYQSKESIGESSYVSDDYFGFLRDGEGANPTAASIDLGIGRFPVSTLSQARNAVDKVISYMENAKHGPWKNKLCFVADDGNSGDDFTIRHMEQSDSLTRYIEYNHPEFIAKKLFFDAYKLSYSGGKPTYPEIRTNIQKELKNGVLIINYTGHGDAASWAEERVMTQTDINNATYTNLPLWITAACDFAPFDAPSTSAGEDVFLNKKSGGIALFTTARVAYREPNFVINKLFLENLFQKHDGRHQTLGEVMMNTKREYGSREKLSFFLLGDPALTLAYPDEYGIDVKEINGKPVDEAAINIKAFEKVTVKGAISGNDGSPASDFDGLLSVTVFDSQAEITTLDNNATDIALTYRDYPNIIYLGNDSVRNGEFTFTFTVPKDISYSNKNGKISLYATDDRVGAGKDACGSFKNFTVGGTDEVTDTDTEGPEIRSLYLNTPDFRDGDKVNETPMFVAVIRDGSGINVGGSSIGHDIMLTIDNNPSLSYSLNNYYETYLEGEDGESIVKFPLPKIEAGAHYGEFTVWDIHNNSSTAAFRFAVADNYKPSIINLTAGPSPASGYVDFIISHDLPESLVKVEIQVYDLTGRIQWKHEETGSSAMFDSYSVRWNLTSLAGARLPSGIYIYRAVIGNNGSNATSKSNKLIIQAQ